MLKNCLKIAIFSFFLSIYGCASLPPPKNTSNLCHIFKKRPKWYAHAHRASKKWNVPIPVMMAIMKQESHFKAHAKPPRQWFLFIPLPRNSSAYGYAQAQDPVWKEYVAKASTSWFPSRSNFGDSIDFIGWYIKQTHSINNVPSWRTEHLYLNYHDGWTGYRQGTWKRKTWLRDVAKKVSTLSYLYKQQMQNCRL